VRPSQLGSSLNGVDRNRETRFFTQVWTLTVEVKAYILLDYIDHDDTHSYKGGVSLLLSREHLL
jgi:hypothetical protein